MVLLPLRFILYNNNVRHYFYTSCFYQDMAVVTINFNKKYKTDDEYLKKN